VRLVLNELFTLVRIKKDFIFTIQGSELRFQLASERCGPVDIAITKMAVAMETRILFRYLINMCYWEETDESEGVDVETTVSETGVVLVAISGTVAVVVATLTVSLG
jgi:hypothetical protein